MTALTFEDALEAVIRSHLEDLRVSVPGQIWSYADGKASIKVGLQRPRLNSDGETTYQGEPLIPDVPVMFPAGGGTSIRWTPQRGDSVLLVVSDWGITEWLDGDDTAKPRDSRAHALGNCFAVPWDRSGDNSGGTIEITADTVDLGGGSAQYMARADRVDSDMQKILDLLQSWTVAPNDGGAALKAAALTVSLDGSASDRVKGT
jgi:hypothetical protein